MKKFNTPSYVVNMSRTLKISEFAIKFYALLALLAVVVFGYFGIIPLYRVVKEKGILIKDMSRVNDDLKRNIIAVKEIQTNLETYQGAVSALDKYMPATFDSHNFLLDFISTVAPSGFFVTRFTPDSSDSLSADTLTIRVDLSGAGNVDELINNIEKMKRITQVRDLRYTFEDNIARNQKKVTLSVEVYSTRSL